MVIDINFPKSWKTSLGGIAAGVAAVLVLFKQYGIHDWTGAVKDPTFVLMCIVAYMGVVAKDGNVTGGTSGQPSTPEALHAANQEPSTKNPPEAK